MDRPCDVCGAAFTAKRPTARYCGDRCRKQAQRSGLAEAKPPLTSVPDALSDAVPVLSPPRAVVGLAARCRQTLESAGRGDTWEAEAALSLAERIENSRMDTGSAFASLQRELRAAMKDALTGAGEEGSAVQKAKDDLAERRKARGSA